MERVLIAVGIALAAALLAWVLERRRPQAPTQRRWAVPDQLDRADFERPGAPWLVAVFSSATCDSCADAVARVQDLASADVVVQEVELATRGDLHRRYNVEAVPTLVVADRQGVVRASFVGPPPPDELATALSEVTSG
jgi:protein-disulfide isomerase